MKFLKKLFSRRENKKIVNNIGEELYAIDVLRDFPDDYQVTVTSDKDKVIVYFASGSDLSAVGDLGWYCFKDKTYEVFPDVDDRAKPYAKVFQNYCDELRGWRK